MPAVDRGALLGEAYRRGILPPEQRGLYEEGLRRGLFKAPPAPAGNAGPAEMDVMAPESPGAPAPAAVPDIANPLGAMGSAFTRGPGELRRQQESFTARAKAAEEESRLQQGYEPGVDYESGIGFGDRINYNRMDNPAERRGMLESRYGAGNVFQDKGGRFYVQTEAGAKVAPEGEGFITNLLASIYGHAPQIAGGAYGAAQGAASGAILGAPIAGVGALPGAAIGALAGGGLGTAAGKAADEALKLVFGQQRKTLGEEVGALGQAGIEGVVGEGAGRMLSGAPGVLGRAFRKYVAKVEPDKMLPGGEVVPGGVSLNRGIAQAGGVSPVRTLLPGLTGARYAQDVSTRIGSDFLEKRNLSAVQNRLSQIIEGAGKTPAQVSAEISEVLNPAARVEAQTAGTPIVGAVRQHAAQLEGEVANLARDADRMLTGQLGRLNALSRRSPAGELGKDVPAGFVQARTDFSNAMQKGYAQLDRMTGGAPVVPQQLVQRRAQAVWDALPKDTTGEPIFGDPNVVRSLKKLIATPSAMPLGEAKAIRSTLGDFGELKDLIPGVAKQQFDQLRRAQDAAIGQAALDPAVAPAIRLLRQLDKTYAEGVRKFGDAEINSMVSQARTGIVPDPGKVAEMVLVPGQTQRAATIKRMVGPDVWKRVAAADWENNLIGPARDAQTGEVSARRLARAVEARDRGGMLDLTYGPAVARDIRLYSKRLDQRGGTVPGDWRIPMAPDNFGQTIRQLEVAQREQDAFLKTNYLSELAKPGTLDDGAVNFVLQPGKQERLVKARDYFGDTSTQMEGIRDQARKELLNSAIKTTEGGEITVAGKGLENALAKWTPKQQEILFRGQAEDIRRLAREVNFMFPLGSPDALSGSLFAGTINATPIPFRWVASAPVKTIAWILSRPATMRVLSEGLKPGPGQEATRESIRMIARAAAAGQLDDDQPAEPEPIAEQITGARHARPERQREQRPRTSASGL